jgi:hypothetical protein
MIKESPTTIRKHIGNDEWMHRNKKTKEGVPRKEEMVG